MPVNSLTRDVVAVLVVKAIVVIAAGLFVFGPGQRLHVDSSTIDAHFIQQGH